jgi:hypothetical protein
MSVADFATLVEKISLFCRDAVIDISLWGEPALHPESICIMLPGILLECTLK